LSYKETLSDIDDEEVQEFLLTPEESELKSVLWEHLNQDWIEEQNLKKAHLPGKKGVLKKRKKKNNEFIDAPNPVDALQHSEKLKGRINHNALEALFNDSSNKKVKAV
jgi:transcription factor IIIB subunit 2